MPCPWGNWELPNWLLYWEDWKKLSSFHQSSARALRDELHGDMWESARQQWPMGAGQ